MQHVMAKIGKFFDADLDPHEARGRQFLAILLSLSLASGLLLIFTSPVKALTVILTILTVIFTVWRPTYIIVFLAVYTPFEPFLLKFVPDEIYIYARYFSESLLYFLLFSAFIHILFQKRRWVPTPLDIPFVFFLLVAITSLIINQVHPVFGILGLRQIIRFILLFFTVIYLQPETRFIKRLTAVMLGVVAFEGILGTIQGIVGAPLDEFLIPSERRFFESIQLTSGTTQFWSPGARVFATLGRYDQLGTFLCFFFLLVFGLLYYLKATRERFWMQCALLMSGAAFILTLSRASWFGFALGLFVIGGILMKDWKVRIAYVAVIVLAFGYLAYSGLVVKYLVDYPQQTAVERLFEAFSFERWRGEYYGFGRLYWIVQTPLVVVRSSPLFGVGPGQFGGGAAAALGNTTVYEKLNLPFGVAGTNGYIDNNWFALWGETGTLGLIFYVWMVVILAVVALRTWRNSKDPFVRGLALGYFGAVLAVSFQAILGTYLEVRTLALYLWMYGAFIYILAKRERLVV